MEPMTLEGKRWGAVGGFLLTAPAAGLSVALLVHLIRDGELGRAAVVAALALFMVFSACDFGIKLIRPNRLLLTREGFTLETAFRSRSWSWDRYAGLHGWYNRLLLTREPSVGRRRHAIGHWQPDLERVIGTYAQQAGRDVDLASVRDLPSPLPFFIVSGLIVAAIVVALALS